MSSGGSAKWESHPDSERQPNAAVQSVDRALLVLEILAARGQGRRRRDRRRAWGAQVHSVGLIAVLESRGYVEQTSEGGRYRLGFPLARLARASSGHLDDRGWASVVEELEVGLNAVSGPVYDAGSDIIAALSVSGPAYRFHPDRFSKVAKQTRAAAEVISRRLGWVEGG